MALDFHGKASEIQLMEIPELIPTVQFLFERYVSELINMWEDEKVRKSLKKRYYRLYWNKKPEIANVQEIRIDWSIYYVELKTTIDNIRSLAQWLLTELNQKTPKN